MHETNPLAVLCDLHLSDKEKRLLWQRILQRQQKSLFLRKVFFATRVSGYIAVSTLGIFVLISSFWPQQDTGTMTTNAPFLALRSDKQHIAQADTIGRLVEIQGVVHVINNGTILPKTDISAGETIVLQPGAELVLQIRAATFATIQGPAKLVLEYVPETQQTVLNLLEGKLIEVTTKITPTTPTPTSDTSLTIPAETPTLTDRVVIKTKLVEVTPPTNQTSSFVIHQEDKSAEVIATAGSNMLVKQLDPTLLAEDSGDTLLVNAGTHAHIDLQGIHLPTTSDEATQLARQSKDLTIRYEKPTSDTTLLALVADIADQPSSPSTSVDEDILNDIAAKIDTSLPTVLPTNLLERLTQTLHPTIIAQNLADMKTRQGTNTNAYIIAYSNLLGQINQAYHLLGATQPATSTDSLDAGIAVAQHLLALLERTYTTPPSLRDSLQSVINGLAALKNNTPPEHNVANEQPTQPQDDITETGSTPEEPTLPETQSGIVVIP